MQVLRCMYMYMYHLLFFLGEQMGRVASSWHWLSWLQKATVSMTLAHAEFGWSPCHLFGLTVLILTTYYNCTNIQSRTLPHHTTSINIKSAFSRINFRSFRLWTKVKLHETACSKRLQQKQAEEKRKKMLDVAT